MSDPKQDEVPLPEPGMQEINPYRDLGPLDPHKGAGLLVWFDRNQLIAYGNARARAATERAAQVARSHLGGGNDGVIHFIAEAIEADVGIKGDGRG